MRSFEEDPVSDDELDLDRIIIDAEYRRYILARLREKRASTQSDYRASLPSAGSALRHED